MYDFHQNKSRYFEMTYWVADQFVIPFLDLDKEKKYKVCEIGCGEAGVLKAFRDKGYSGVGIELMEHRAALAKQGLAQEINEGRATVINKNVYDIDPNIDTEYKFDIIVLKDVIEHIPQQEIFVKKLKDLLNPGGIVFFAYPPWWMPFGGHQQICKNKLLSKLPWFHLLPTSIYKKILQIGGEQEVTVKDLLDIKDTGITIEKMHRIIKEAGYTIVKEKYWLTNPIYVKKFNMRPLQSVINIPFLRNFYVTAHYITFK